MLDVLKDIRSRALPANMIPGYIVWVIGKSFWFWFGIVAVGIVVVVK